MNQSFTPAIIQGRKFTYFGHTLRFEGHKNIGTTAGKDAEEGQEEDELKIPKNGQWTRLKITVADQGTRDRTHRRDLTYRTADPCSRTAHDMTHDRILAVIWTTMRIE